MSQSGWVHIDVDWIKHETEAAFLCMIDGEEVWIPKSQVNDVDHYDKDDKNVSMSITEFIANKLELE